MRTARGARPRLAGGDDVVLRQVWEGVEDGACDALLETPPLALARLRPHGGVRGFFTPAELWNVIQQGGEYDIRGFGLRVGMLGWYPTVYAAKPAQ